MQIAWLDWLEQKLGIDQVAITAAGNDSAGPGAGSGPVIDVPSHEVREEPVRHSEHDTFSSEREPTRKQARDNFLDEADIFLNIWMGAGNLALSGAPEVDDPESQTGWWIALAGNMIWAATCLVPEAQAMKALIIGAMSFGGAAAGSGAVSPVNEKAPSGKKMISEMLSKTRDSMAKAAGPVMDRAAIQCGAKKIENKEAQRKVPWRYLFSTPFEDSNAMREEMSGKIEAGLKSFNEQWHTWRKEIQSVVLKRANEVQSGNMDEIGGRLLTKNDYDWAMKKHPFQPKISFD